jgi:heme/copper-type cytochrome/quinol oxidase subunit 3
MTMTDTTALPPDGLETAAEEAAFYHEAALNASWTGIRLALGALSLGFGSFIFAFFYLKSLNSHGLWYPAGFPGPQPGLGALVTGLIVASAVLQTIVLQRIKAGHRAAWLRGAAAALVLGVAAAGVQIGQLLTLPFFPGASGFASVFTGFWPVYIVIALAALTWLEILIMRCRQIPEIFLVEQPPTYAEAFAVQRFQAGLSAFTILWNYLAVVAVFVWFLFYVVH